MTKLTDEEQKKENEKQSQAELSIVITIKVDGVDHHYNWFKESRKFRQLVKKRIPAAYQDVQRQIKEWKKKQKEASKKNEQ